MPDHITLDEVRHMFSRYGEIGDIFIPTNDSGKRKKFMFVRYLNKKDQQKAETRMHGKDIFGQYLNVKSVKNRNETGSALKSGSISSKFVTGFQQQRYLETVKRNHNQLISVRSELERRETRNRQEVLNSIPGIQSDKYDQEELFEIKRPPPPTYISNNQNIQKPERPIPPKIQH